MVLSISRVIHKACGGCCVPLRCFAHVLSGELVAARLDDGMALISDEYGNVFTMPEVDFRARYTESVMCPAT